MQQEMRRLKRANEMATSSFSRGSSTATSLVRASIDAHRDRFGVEPMCRKVWRQLQREGVGIRRGRVERLMRAERLVVARRRRGYGRSVPTPAPHARRSV